MELLEKTKDIKVYTYDEVYKSSLDYFKGDELATNVFISKYCLKSKNGTYLELNPDDMHKRMSKEFSRVSVLTEDSIYELFKDFKYLIPQGSVMYGCGNDEQVISLSNCFVVGQPKDTYSSIILKDLELASIYKRRGGCGIDISSLRPKGTIVNNAANTSTGAVSFMERYSNTTREAAQNGRRGALMITLDVRHPDIEEFIQIKQDLTKVTGANISIMLNDDFMKSVESDSDYILRFPCGSYLSTDKYDEWYPGWNNGNINYIPKDDCYVKVVKAKELWNKIIKAAHNTAEPGLIFKDRQDDYCPSNIYPEFKNITTNPCFTKDTQILSSNGYIKIGESVGELDLINKNGDIVNGRIWSNGNKEVIQLILSNKQRIKCTPDHTFMVNDNTSCQAQDLFKKRLMPFYEINQEVSEFTKYGFIQGDGGLGRLNSESHKGLEINIGDKDDDIFELFNIDKEENKRSYYINGFNEILKSLQFDASSLPIRKFPTTFTFWENSDKLMFLKGMYSANGSIIKGQRIAYKTTSQELAYELQNWLNSFLIDSYITINKEKNVQFSNGNYTCKQSYDINISKYESVLKFARLIGFVHKYKQESLEQLIKDKAPLVLSINFDLPQEEVFDFSLEDSEHWGVIEGVIAHNCSEIMMGEYDSCRLMCLNLFSFVDNPFTEKAEFNFNKWYEIVSKSMILSDCLVDLELEKVSRIVDKITSDKDYDSNELELWTNVLKIGEHGRRTGLGITGLGDMLAALGYKYDSKEALEIVDIIMNQKLKSELNITIELSKELGSFNGWNDELEYKDSENNNSFFSFIKQNFYEEWVKMQEYGRRNVSWSTVAPTGSLSILGGVSSGIEPLFQPYYIRRKKVNPNDVNVRVDFTDKNGDTWQEFPVIHNKFRWWLNKSNNWNPNEPEYVDNLTKEELNKYFEKSPWYKSTANEIDWIKRVEMQSIIQKYTTHSISSTINLPKDVSLDEVSNIYIESWKKGLKGITIYRDTCRDGVLVTDTNKSERFGYKDAIKRPKNLPCEVHTVKVKGKDYIVIVGLMNNLPYEVFACENQWGFKKINGEVIKKNKRQYKLETNDINLDNIVDYMTSEEEVITRLISTSLRHGTNIQFIVEQLNKTEGNLVGFDKAIARVLKSYIPEQDYLNRAMCSECGSVNLKYENGCFSCKDCGSSKCG